MQGLGDDTPWWSGFPARRADGRSWVDVADVLDALSADPCDDGRATIVEHWLTELLDAEPHATAGDVFARLTRRLDDLGRAGACACVTSTPPEHNSH